MKRPPVSVCRRTFATTIAVAAVHAVRLSGEPAAGADLLERGLQGWVSEGTVEMVRRGESIRVWTCVDGVVRCSGHGFGYLRHDSTVEDFRLALEYRFPKPGNSGIGIRTRPFTGDIDTRPSKVGYEIQLLSDAGKQPSRGSCSALYGYEAPTRNTSLPVGEWNSLVIEARGPRITVAHNGSTVIDFDQSTRPDTAGKPLHGSICLQNHGSEVEFRKVRLEALTEPVP